MSEKKRKEAERRDLREKDTTELPMDEFVLEITSMTTARLKKGFREFGKALGSAFEGMKNKIAGGGARLKALLKEVKPSLGKERELGEKPPREGLKEELQVLRRKFSPPRPEITLFHLERTKFLPYSTSKEEETRGDIFYSSLASIDSAGRNIVKALADTASSIEHFSLEGREIYDFLPTKDETFCFGRIEGTWLFFIRSRRFSRERFSPPEGKAEKTYDLDGLKVFIDQKLDLLLKERGKRTGEDVYSQLADSFKIAYRSTLKDQSVGTSQDKEQTVAIYLIHTPQSRLSPFLLIRLEKKKELAARIFPIWFNYEENKLIRTAKRIKQKYRDLSSPVEAPLPLLHAFKNLKREIGEKSILLATQRFLHDPDSVFVFDTEKETRLFSSFLERLIGSMDVEGDVRDLLNRRLGEYETMSRKAYETAELNKERTYFVKEAAENMDIGEKTEGILDRLKDSSVEGQLQIFRDEVINLAVNQFLPFSGSEEESRS